MLSGKIAHIDAKYVILETGGIGYKISLTDDALHTMKGGAEMTFWTYLAVRENALDLYGFLAKKEKDIFELLIGVSGIGPKSALNILSLVSGEQLVSAVRTGSTAHLVKVSGIGRKTAEKVVLELKDKLSLFTGQHGAGMSAEMSAGMSSDMDATLALKALGYGADEARDALKKVAAASEKSGKSNARELDTGAKVKAALKELGK